MLIFKSISFFDLIVFFQTKEVVVNDLHDMIIELYTEILQCFLKKDYISRTPLNEINPKNGQYQLINNQLYLSINVMRYKDKPEIVKDQHHLKDFYEKKYIFFLLFKFYFF